MSEHKKICLVDDHVLIRNALKELIEKLGPYQVMMEFDDGLDFKESLDLNDPPDLVLLDLSMPRMTGQEVMQWLNTKKSSPPVLILTLNDEEETVSQLFRLGARGYLTKNVSPVTMKNALEDVFRTGYFHNEFLVNSLRNKGPANEIDSPSNILDRMSSREREFLKLICNEKEYTYEQIADLMGVQFRTVDGYRETIFNKFKIRSKTGLVLFVLKYKLYDLL
ncbi:MAG TPA: response regulator transcription factor [Bacteroidia bacterium]|nr:response regulator transcription factor [Bacteroidia bacterium]